MNTKVSANFGVARSHLYSTAGTRTARGRFIDPTGRTAQADVEVEVLPPPDPNTISEVRISPADTVVNSVNEAMAIDMRAEAINPFGDVLTGRTFTWQASNAWIQIFPEGPFNEEAVVGTGIATENGVEAGNVIVTAEGVSDTTMVTFIRRVWPEGLNCVAMNDTGPMDPSDPQSSHMVELSVSCSQNYDSQPIEHRWTYGDGSGATAWIDGAATTEHEYAVGDYDVMFEVRQAADQTGYYMEMYDLAIEEGSSQQPVAFVNLSIPDTFAEGETVVANAMVQASDGTVLDDREVTWTKDGSEVLLSPTGLQAADVLGMSAGSVTITATAEGVSDSKTVTVTAPPVHDATAAGNSFPAAMSQGQFYAVSLTMNNTGTNSTWTDDDGFSLGRTSPAGADWLPATVSLGSSVIAPGQSKTFQFNLYNEAAIGQDYDVLYRMRESGNFGATNGRTITVLDPSACTKNCGGLASYQVGSTAFVPGGAVGSPGAGLSDEVVQSLVVDDYPVRFIDVDGSDTAYIRYFGSLDEAWRVDVTFTITFDKKLVSFGQIRKGINLAGYDLEVEQDDVNSLRVRLTRRGINEALPAGEEVFLEIPIVGKPNQPRPATLPRVELTVTR